MGTNRAPLLADLFVYSYESEFLQKLVNDKRNHEARAFNFTYRYIYDILSINNSRFAEFRPLPNSEQSNKGKVKTHKYTNRQNQSTTGKL